MVEMRQQIETLLVDLRPDCHGMDWAWCKLKLAVLFMRSNGGGENIEKAIRCLEEALQISTREAHPDDWATAKANLGWAYYGRTSGEERANIEMAIRCLEEALQISTRDALPQKWAKTKSNLGSAYLNRISGEKRENIEVAIGCCEEALQVYTREAHAEDWARTKMNLGNAYSARISGEKRENIGVAIGCCEEALQVYTREAHAEDWARTKMNLGNAYSARISGEKRENIGVAIGCCEEALQVYTREAHAEDWAKTKMNLGSAYSARISGEKRENIEAAIGCYEEALQVYTREALPNSWAMAKANLGNAYLNRISGVKRENIEAAIGYYEEALLVPTREAHPDDWAKTKMNLGSAYQDRISGEKCQNIEAAIACYEEALQVSTREAYPEDWAMVKANLGIAYCNRISGDKSKNIEAAIRCYREALQVRTRDALPEKWAMTKSNLGNAYKDRISGGKCGNVEAAIRCYKEVLQICTREWLPERWAVTKNNLGVALFDLLVETGDSSIVTKAISVFEDVQSFAADLLLATPDAEGRRKLRERFATCDHHLVALHMYNRNPTKALVQVERARARGVADLTLTTTLERQDAPSQVHAYIRIARDLQLQSRLYELGDENRLSLEEMQELTREVEDSKRAAAAADPDFAKALNQLEQPIVELAAMKAALGPRTIGIVWYFGFQWSGVFALADKFPAPKHLQYDQEQVENIRWTSAEYLEAVTCESLTNDDDVATAEAAADLAGALLLSDINTKLLCNDDTIAFYGASMSHLVLLPHKSLHGIPLDTLPINGKVGGHSFADSSTSGITTVPSFYLLRRARDAIQPLALRRLVAVQDPANDLPHAVLELDNIKALVTARNRDQTQPPLLIDLQLLRGDTATQGALIDQLPDGRDAHISVLHFACHGSFSDEDDVWQAGLQLAGGSRLTVGDVLQHAQLFRNVELCVLSACETGMHDGALTRTDECVGLATVLLAVGVPRVLASLWLVNDMATSLLVWKLYDELLCNRGQKDLSAALRAAQYWLRTLTVGEIDTKVKLYGQGLGAREFSTLLADRWQRCRTLEPAKAEVAEWTKETVWLSEFGLSVATEARSREDGPPAAVAALDTDNDKLAKQLCSWNARAAVAGARANGTKYKAAEWAAFVYAFENRQDPSKVAAFDFIYSHLFPMGQRSLCERSYWFRHCLPGAGDAVITVLHVHYHTPWGTWPDARHVVQVNVRGVSDTEYQHEPHPLLKTGIMSTKQALILNQLGKKGTWWSGVNDAPKLWDSTLPVRSSETEANVAAYCQSTNLPRANCDKVLEQLGQVQSVLAVADDKLKSAASFAVDAATKTGFKLRLKDRAPDYKPFESPRYWAAFVLYGTEAETVSQSAAVAVQRGSSAATAV